MSTHLLPRLRTRRRRKRPLSPMGWLALAACGTGVLVIAMSASDLVSPDSDLLARSIDLILLYIWMGSKEYGLRFWWPILKAEIRRMDDDG